MSAGSATPIALTDANVSALENKFADEIEDLNRALDDEMQSTAADSEEIRSELRAAIGQSEDIFAELHAVHDMLRSVCASGRALTEEECSAIKYFGFVIPANRRLPAGAFPTPATPRAGSPAIQLPPPRSASKAGAASSGSALELETETDISEAYGRGRRDLTPDIDDGARHSTGSFASSTGPAPLPAAAFKPTTSPSTALPPVAPTPSSAPPAARPSAPTPSSSVDFERAVEEEVRRRVDSAKVILDAQLADAKRAADERIAAAEASVADRAAQRAKSIADSLIAEERRNIWEQAREQARQEVDDIVQHEVTKQAAENRRAFEQELRQLRRQHDDDATQVAAELKALQSKLTATEDSLRIAQRDLDDSRFKLSIERQKSDDLRSALQQAIDSDKKAARAEWIALVRDTMGATYDDLAAENRRLQQEADAIRQEAHHRLDDLSANIERMEEEHRSTTTTSSSASPRRTALEVARAEDVLRAVDAPFLYSTASTDPLDRAVVATLNQLALPVAFQVRRIGPAGDYFIDKRVHLKLVNGEVLVRKPGASSPTANEPLSRYLVQLYAPVLYGQGTSGLVPVQQQQRRFSPDSAHLAVGEDHQQHLSPAPTPISHATPSAAAPPPPPSSHADDISRIVQLQEEQRRLTQRLEQQQERLRQHRAAQQSSNHQTGEDLNTTLQRQQRARMQEALATEQLLQRPTTPSRSTATVSRPSAATTATANTSTYSSSRGPLPSGTLASLGDDQIELLKRLALAKQVKEMRRQQSIAARKP